MKLTPTLLIAFFSLGCSTTAYISPNVSGRSDLEMIYHQGKEVTLSYQDHSSIAFYGGRNQQEITLHILVSNDSEEYVNIIPDSIIVFGIDSQGRHIQLQTINPDRYIKRLQNQQALVLALTAIDSAIKDANAGTSTTTTYGNISGAGASYNYFSLSQTRNESKRRDAQRQSQNELNQQALQAQLYRDSVKQGLLLKTTLFPSAQIEGNVMIQYEKFDRYFVEIPIGNDVHRISFILVES